MKPKIVRTSKVLKREHIEEEFGDSISGVPISVSRMEAVIKKHKFITLNSLALELGVKGDILANFERMMYIAKTSTSLHILKSAQGTAFSWIETEVEAPDTLLKNEVLAKAYLAKNNLDCKVVLDIMFNKPIPQCLPFQGIDLFNGGTWNVLKINTPTVKVCFLSCFEYEGQVTASEECVAAYLHKRIVKLSQE